MPSPCRRTGSGTSTTATSSLPVPPSSGHAMHQHFLGGGFGRRLESDMVVAAVAASKGVGKPVKLIFAREDDMQMDFTRPLTYQKVKVGLDGNGKPVAMEHDVIGAWPTAKWGIPAFL